MSAGWRRSIHTAADVAAARSVLMKWGANLEAREAAGDDLGDLADWRQSLVRQAAEITDRAVTLGLEPR